MNCIFVTVIIKYNNFFASKMYFTFPPLFPSQPPPFLLSPALPIHFPLFRLPTFPPSLLFPFFLRYLFLFFPFPFSLPLFFPLFYPSFFSFSFSFPSLLLKSLTPPPPGKNFIHPCKLLVKPYAL